MIAAELKTKDIALLARLGIYGPVSSLTARQFVASGRSAIMVVHAVEGGGIYLWPLVPEGKECA